MVLLNKACNLEDLNTPEYKNIVDGVKSVEDLLISEKIPYTFMGKENLGGAPKYWEFAHIFSNIPVNSTMRVLDAGGGNSIVLPFLHHKFGATVCTLDLSSASVSAAINLRNKLMFSEENKIICGDMAQASKYFEPEIFDRIFSFSVIEHIPNDGDIKAITELAKLLKPGGIIGLTMDIYSKYIRGKDLIDPKKPIMSQEYWWVQEQMYDTRAIIERLVEPSGLTVYGNKDFDYTTNFVPTIYGRYSEGALCLIK